MRQWRFVLLADQGSLPVEGGGTLRSALWPSWRQIPNIRVEST